MYGDRRYSHHVDIESQYGELDSEFITKACAQSSREYRMPGYWHDIGNGGLMYTIFRYLIVALTFALPGCCIIQRPDVHQQEINQMAERDHASVREVLNWVNNQIRYQQTHKKGK